MAKSRARKLADIIVGAGVDIDGNLTFSGGSTSDDLTFADNDKANFGTSSDLQIYHNGSHSFIKDAGTGDLYIGASNNLALMNSAFSENYLLGTTDGAVTLYYDGSSKLATFSGGVSVTGQVNATTMHLPDGSTGLQLGSSNDTKFFHDGSNSKITHSGSGGFYIGADTLGLQTGAHNENYLTAAANGAVSLYYDNSAKLATASGGITVTGETNTSTLASGNSTMTGLVQIGNSSGGTLFFKRPNANYIFADQTGGYLVFGTNGRSTMVSNSNFYLGTDQSSTFVGSVSFNDSISADGPITINGSGSEDRYLQFALDGRSSAFTGQNAAFIFCGQGGSGDFLAGGLYLQSRSATAGREIGFITGTTPAKRMVIDASGNVGINTASPSARFEVTGDAIQLTNGSYFKAVQTTNSANAGYYMASGSSNWYTLVDTSGRYQIYDGDAAEVRVIVDGSGNVGIGTTSPESLLTLENDDATLRIRSATTTTKGLTLRYNDSGNFGQLLVDHQGNNQLAMKYYALSHSFGRSDSDVNITMDDSGRLLIGSTTTEGSSSERFLVKSTGSNHSRFINSSDTYTTVYIKNTSTTANTNQPFLTFQDTGGNRGNFGLRYSTAQLVIQGHGGVGIAAGSGGISQDPNLFVNTSGNVGIGTTSPSTVHGNTVLQVSGTTGAEVVVHRNDAGAELHDYIGGFLFYNGDTSGSDPHYSGMIGKASDIYGSSNLEFYAGRGALEDHTNETPHMIIVGDSNNNSKVGINTDSPAYILDVNGTAQFSPGSSAALFQEYANGMALWLDGSDGDFIGGDYFGIHAYGTTSLDFSYGAATKFKMLSDGRVGINRTPSITNSKLEVGGADNVPLINVEASGNTGGIGIGSSGLQLFHGSSAKMYIKSDGKVGIGGTSMDGQRLNIEGWAQSNTRTAANAWLVGRGTGGDGLAIGTSASSPYATWLQSGYLPTMGTSNHYALSFNPHGGNVGIGDTSPSETLELTRLGKIGFGMNGNYGVRIGYFDDTGGVHGFHVDTKHGGTVTSETRFVVRADTGRVSIGLKNPTADGLTIGTINNNCELDLHHTGTSGTRWRLNSNASGTFYLENKTDGYIPITVLSNSFVGFGRTAPSAVIHTQNTGSAHIKMQRNTNVVGFELSGSSSGGYGLYDYTGTQYDAWFKNGKVTIGGSTDALQGLTVKGTIGSYAGETDLATHTLNSYATVQNSGTIEFVLGYQGTLAAGRVFTFTYEATSWKSWAFEIEAFSTDGYVLIKAGGYNNNSSGKQIYELGDGGNGGTLTHTNSGQHNVFTFTLDSQMIHPGFKIKYTQTGADGAPRMDRMKVVLT